VSGEYLAGTTYSARAFLRSPEKNVRVQLVLGSAPKEVATGPGQLLSDSWTRTTVTFAPKTSASSVDLSVQKATAGRASIFVDGVVVTDEVKASSEERAVQSATDQASVDVRAQRAAAEDRYSVVSRATLVDESGPRTVLWTLLGALAGLLAGGAGVAAAMVARSRRDRAE